MMMEKIFIVAFSLLIAITLHAELSEYEQQMVLTIPFYHTVADQMEPLFASLAPTDYPATWVQSDVSNPLFRNYPTLQSTLSYLSFGDLPTPIHECKNLSARYNSTTILIKHDGITGRLNADGTRAYGGNKLRKLQYLLADALAHGHDSVITFGCVGSNHVAQTAVCANDIGLYCYSMLKSQPNSRIVQKNLLLQRAYDAIINFSDTLQQRAHATLELCAIHKQKTGMIPYIIPTGGSIARGAIGYVEAAFELKEQIEAGILQKPDHIYVTLGSGGTAAGLLLGCKAAGINVTFHCVLDEPGDKDKAWVKLHTLFTATNNLLISLDPAFPRCTLTEQDCLIVTTHSGIAYGLFTEAGIDAIKTVQAYEGITLDGVYSSKCMSALFTDLEAGILHNSIVLFWNTFCAETMNHITDQIDYRTLPETVQVYFEQDTQPLDN
jgi:D-cysteine desulfhydrase